MYKINDVVKITGASRTKIYAVIKELNIEIKKQKVAGVRPPFSVIDEHQLAQISSHLEKGGYKFRNNAQTRTFAQWVKSFFKSNKIEQVTENNADKTNTEEVTTLNFNKQLHEKNEQSNMTQASLFIQNYNMFDSDLTKATLTESEIQQGAFVGMQRCVFAITSNLRNEQSNAWQNDIEGALAEMAFAKLLNVHWDGKIGKIEKGDVGHWEIRQTKMPDGHLLIYPSDLNDASYVLMTGQKGVYEVRGWILGREGKQHKYWRADVTGYRPCFWVPQSDLRSIETHHNFPNSSLKESA